MRKSPMNSMGQRDPVTQSTTPLNASRFASRKAKSKKDVGKVENS